MDARALKFLLVPVLAVALYVGGERLFSSQSAGSAEAAQLPSAGLGPKNYAEALRANADRMALNRERVSNGPDEWLRQSGLAGALMGQSALEGDFASLVEAQETIARANALAPAGAGPFLEAVHAVMGAHRLDLAEIALDGFDRQVVPGTDDERSDAESYRGDIAFYRGQLDEAERHYGAALAIAPSPGILFRQALAAKARGEFGEAEQLFIRSGGEGRGPSPQTLASITLNLGGIAQARGDYAGALELFRRADALFPGSWLYEAHIAQGEYLTGDKTAAMRRLAAMLENEQPVEVMELYALLLQEEGRPEESRRWSDRAAAIWDERLAQLPSASYAHAIEHQLVFGTPARALELARLNLTERPYGEARLLMAEALLANDRPAEALAQIRAARSAGWLSAPHLRAEVHALEALGRTREALAVRAEAVALNPHVFERISQLVWLSHG